jgi:hypothetical protein
MTTIITGAALAPATAATVFLCLSILWVAFLIYDAHIKGVGLSTFRQLGLFCHTIPAMFFLAITKLAQPVRDTALVWFVALMVFRYWRIVVNIWYWFQYRPAIANQSKPCPSKADCTVIVPTVGPKVNPVFEEMVASILANHPARLILSTNTLEIQEKVKALLYIKVEIDNDKTTEVIVWNADKSNKREQVVAAFSEVLTDITAMADDTAIWHPGFLDASLPAFQSEQVGFVGTCKWVKRVRHTRDPEANFFLELLKQYVVGFWNTIGGLYLVRHNFEIRATNAADGGVFCVSGRSSLIRTEIVNSKHPNADPNANFEEAFLNEFILRFDALNFPGWGPVKSDDDNFITRWVINHGWRVKIQYSEAATITTVLGGTAPLKFPLQAVRWIRTTFRQDPIALFADRTCWCEWPLTTWTTVWAWMYNAALVWDWLAIYTLTQTNLYAQTAHPGLLLMALVGFIWMSKLVKTIPWF